MTRTIALAASIAMLLVGVASPPAHAQSALDGFNPGANDLVQVIAVQPDGKILVGGSFTGLGGGGTGSTPRNYIGRLSPDGTLDASFNPGANGPVQALAVQPDGKILIGGAFTMLGGGGTGTTPGNFIGRVNSDGSVDPTFNLDSFIGTGPNGSVGSIVVQPDGKILVGGGFTSLDGDRTVDSSGLDGSISDGSLDTTFRQGSVRNSAVFAVALQPDGKILVGGYSDPPFSRAIRRLHSDGTLDTSFDPGANGTVLALAVQPDGKILVGGSFTTLGGGGTGTTPRSSIGRLHPDGSLDCDFQSGRERSGRSRCGAARRRRSWWAAFSRR